MFIDVDRFKWINDTYGHVAGDRFLGVLSTRLRECVRDHDLVARLGGDEFAIILEETGDWRDISASAERVLDTLSAPVKLAGAEVRGTVSVGIATFPQDGRELSELVKHADDACYHAKALGRANYQFYTEAINLQAARRDKVEDRLRRALQRDLLQVHYQPQVVVGSQEVSGLEALLRWTDDELGAVAPTELVAVAEDAGLSGIVVSRVLSQVADDIRVWVERDLVPPRVWLNASASQLAYLDVAVEQIMESQRLGEDALGVEITESMLVDDPSRAGQALRKLNGLGVKLAIDDFGIGYSSLSALKDYPLDALKIDASFVRNVSENPHDVQIVRAVVSLAHGLGLKVVAEGVETAQQLQTLSEHEVDEIQGHLVSEALPAASVGEWLDHHSFRAASLRS